MSCKGFADAVHDEHLAIKFYKKLLPKVKGKTTKAKVKEIIRDEEDHLRIDEKEVKKCKVR